MLGAPLRQAYFMPVRGSAPHRANPRRIAALHGHDTADRAVESTGNLEVGKGYWLWANEAFTLGFGR